MSEIDPKLSRLYREASGENPPAALDAAILAAARRQIAHPRRRERSSWLRWMAPASAIATLALGVSIALLVEREQPGTPDGAAMREIAPRPQTAPLERATAATKPNAEGSAAPARKEAPVAAPVQAPAPRSAEAAPPAAQAFPADSRAKAAESRTSATKAEAESSIAGDAAVRGLGAAAPAAPAAAGKLAPLRQQAMQRSPQAWLDEINRLRREGRDTEAAEQLAEFRKAYPAYALPESLLK